MKTAGPGGGMEFIGKGIAHDVNRKRLSYSCRYGILFYPDLKGGNPFYKNWVAVAESRSA
jgi:hypothetical protein